MSVRALLPALCLALAGLADGAWAQHRGRPTEFQAPEASDEQLARERARAKTRLHSFSEAEEQPVESSFPWMMLGLGLTAFAVAAPFALRAYHQLARDIRQTEAAHAQPPPQAPARRTKPPNR